MAPKTLDKHSTDTMLMKPENFDKLSTVQQSEVVSRMYEMEKNQKKIATQVGISVPQVSNLLTIYGMPNTLKRFIESGKLSGTLVLQVRRDYKDMSDDEVAELLQNVYAEKGNAITRKDFIKAVDRHNSISLMKKVLKKHNRNSVKKNEVTFEFIQGLLQGKLNDSQIKRFFGFTH